ncbi:hypothetical protein C5S31_02980 [ANME-1 cluster archaeon GoMg2]|nr:hypothetical protein [ANME-1 cluster archaeon GoMg2]
MDSKIKIGSIIVAVLALILISGCIQNKCGDGICQKWEERRGSCPEDCEKITPVEPPVTVDLCKIKSLEKIGEGCFPKWSPDGSLIAYTKEINDNDYQIYTMKPDGSDVKCLTCNFNLFS